jgi:phosphatidylserine/phosphatidylglycerophosphate/cardiolipin synthase-like enzyme
MSNISWLWLRKVFRARSFIARHGGTPLMAARRVLEPFKDHIKKLHGDRAEVVQKKWVEVLSKTVQYGGSFNNNIEVYHDGPTYFEDFWKSIDNAKRSVWVETYTISPDETGFTTIEKLCQAAKRGCNVILIKDAWGSSSMKTEHVKPLLDAGGKVFTFNERHLKLVNFFSRERISTPWFRNHRKCAIIDGKIGFCGGMNVDNKYSGRGFEEILKRIEETQKAAEKLDPQAPQTTTTTVTMPTPTDIKTTIVTKTKEIEVKSEKVTHVSTDHNWYPEHPTPTTLFGAEVDTSNLDPALLLKTAFRDTHCKLTGPSVKYLMDSFLESIEEAKANQVSAWERFVEFVRIRTMFRIRKSVTSSGPTEVTELEDESDESDVEEVRDYSTYKDKEGGVWVQVLSSSPRHGRRQLYHALTLIFSEAQKHVYIITPYFLPPKKLAEAILRAKERGVDVRILTCGLSDVPKMRIGCIWLYGRFLKHGVRIYEYNKSTLHSKILTIDGLFSSLGSYNLDRMSTLSNLEVALNVFDTNTAQDLEKQFFEDLEEASEMTYEKWERRPTYISVVGWILYKMMRLLGP